LIVALLAAPVSQALARDAYVVNGGSNSVSVIDTDKNMVESTIAVGTGPDQVAITPDGQSAYVTNTGSNSVSVINTGGKKVVATIPVGMSPEGIAITPDGSRAYVANSGSDNVSVIDTKTNAIVGSPIGVGSVPTAVAITPDGSRAYVTNAAFAASTVSVIDTGTNATVGAAIPTGHSPEAIAMEPDGLHAYTVNTNDGDVSVISTQSNSAIGSPIPVGSLPEGIALTPDGDRAYVNVLGDNRVSVINLLTDTVVASPAAGSLPQSVAMAPDGRHAFVADGGTNSVSALDTQANALTGPAIPVGAGPQGIALEPQQPPEPLIAVSADGSKVKLNGKGSGEPFGQITRYEWDFGDLHGIAPASPTVRHTYKKVGKFPVKLTVSDADGCFRPVFTGQTALCTGRSTASETLVVAIDKLGKLKRDPSDGTATLKVIVPAGRGHLSVRGRGVVSQKARASGPGLSRLVHKSGPVKLLIRAKGKAKRKLARRGKVKLKVRVRFSAHGAVPNVATKKLKLLKR
jgi:YVTN family beta-propeller protein